MKISFGFDVKSINKAIETIEKVKKQYDEQIVAELLNGCSRWLVDRANELLALTDIGAEVKAGIMNGWSVVQSGNTAVIINTDDKAVFVEFGVGTIGDKAEHPNANKAGYLYDLPTIHKNEQGGWRFTVNDKTELDLPSTAIINQDDTDDLRIEIYTMGAKGAMYAYNALVDLHDYGAKEVWEQIKKKVWG